jgi:tRNA (guanine-N7-)-methyltransferase
LQFIWEETSALAVVRVRQHVNPLSQRYSQPIKPPTWEKLYGDVTLPLHLDLGCGRGRFLLHMAQQHPDWNFLGLEIRQPLVDQANLWRDELGLTNVAFLFCNANVSLPHLLADWPHCPLQRVTIQFPDPWFKKRHQKRRIVQPELVADLATYLVKDGLVFLQSDIEEVAAEMRDRFQENPDFIGLAPDWLPENPLGVPTER